MKIGDILQRMTIFRSALLGMVIAAFYYFIMFDSGVQQQTAINSAKTQVTDLHKQIQENQAKLDRAAVYKKTVAETGTLIHKLLSVIPEHFAMTDLMKILSNEAKVAGSSLVSITPGVTTVSQFAKEFEELNVSIDMNGSFLQHMVFLSNLTKINQILIVRKFDFSSQAAGGKAEEATNVHMTAEIVAYRYKGTPAPAAPAPGAVPPPPDGAKTQ